MQVAYKHTCTGSIDAAVTLDVLTVMLDILKENMECDHEQILCVATGDSWQNSKHNKISTSMHNL